MKEHELEEVMSRFLAGRIDCLVCSTIIESGLDIPNANTIIIERADRFGLGELYQLRGRVGRWKHQAYAYLLLPKHQIITGDARKRIAAIRRCTHLGAGFQLALRDLEIRGSGNILGAEQSGHLNTVGFDLYCHMLKQEVARMKGAEIADFRPETEVGIDFVSFAIRAPAGVLAASFPPSYIESERLRIAAYRKLALADSEEKLKEFRDELRDRYGKLPPQSETLLKYARIKLLASRAGYDSLSVAHGTVLLRRNQEPYRENGKLPAVDENAPPEVRLARLTDIVRRAERAAALAQLAQKRPERP